MDESLKENFRKFERVMTWLGWIAVAGTVIYLCPVWEGRWTREAVTLWLHGTFGMLCVVLLYQLSVVLSKDGHPWLSVLAIMIGMPMLMYANDYLYEHLYDGSGWYPGRSMITLYGDHLGLLAAAFTAAILLGLVGRSLRKRAGRS